MRTISRVRSSSSVFGRYYQKKKDAEAKNLLQLEFALLTYLFSVCSISLIASVMLSMCAKLSSHASLREREQQ